MNVNEKALNSSAQPLIFRMPFHRHDILLRTDVIHLYVITYLLNWRTCKFNLCNVSIYALVKYAVSLICALDASCAFKDTSDMYVCTRYRDINVKVCPLLA